MNPLLDPKTKPGFHNIGRNPNDLTLEELEEGGHKPRSPAKAIRHMCCECMGGDWRPVATCGSILCPLWPFRMGSRPKAWRGLRSSNTDANPHAPQGGKSSISTDLSSGIEEARVTIIPRNTRHGQDGDV